MENASKALIIAGAILISIVLITVGVAVLNQGSDVANSSSMEGTQLQTFNQKFAQYEGTISGSKVKALLNAVITNNQAEENQGSGYFVAINEDLATPASNPAYSSTSSIPNSSDDLRASTMYDVECVYGSGRVVRINITAH